MTSLSDIQEQKKVYLIEINGSGQNINRLETLGFVPGTEITVLQNAGRGPMVVTIKGSKIALGRGMAHRIQVAETREQQMETRLYAQDSELKRTKQRDVILKVISGLEGHQTTEEIAEAVKKQDASIGMTTVYRTLKSLRKPILSAP
ncbi:MAG TPA: FeoA domain-containing protein [bacterium]|nr:FeoA domain-containing protein [bacterium]